ncbi:MULTISPECIES: sensor histidine kinase [unclassified Novosphingobium]|uniref:sensor histidine kinase n=1 Tax=unclassified Novosphingobium TaxID=2644732 RepID=UPI00135B8322|nr:MULTISPECIES: ATP-binding protein [unclassified Novosphingobium]
MKPNEITQRDIENWTRCTPMKQKCRPVEDAAAQAVCGGIDISDARQMFETIAAKSRLADLGEQSSALAHELRQPLFSISVANENLRMMLGRCDITKSQLDKAIARIAQQVERAQTIIDRTLAYASGNSRGAVSADIGLAVSNAVEFLRPLFETADIEIDDRGAHAHAIVGLCQVEAEQVFVNILRNAAESIEGRREEGWQGSGHIAIRIALQGGAVRCVVSDNGAGLSGDTAQAVFQPFFTTKPRVGTGLGLHICRQVLEKAGGSVSLMPGEIEGARVEIELPLGG